MTHHFAFASDNAAGLSPVAMRALETANVGFCPSYGEDIWTQRAADEMRETLETDSYVYIVATGTAANALALATLCQPYHAIIAADCAHVETDECSAPEFFSGGAKLWLASAPAGKIVPEAVSHLASRRSDVHYQRPRVLSVTCPTELGTVYQPAELAALGAMARGHKLKMHLDGARLSNAIAATNVAPRALTWEAGVDVLCFGGSKAGLSLSEAIVFFDRELSREFAYRCKQSGQLISKMRYAAAGWEATLQEGYWLELARHANACAQELSTRLRQLPGAELLHPVDANTVFVSLPAPLKAELRERGWSFYEFIGAHGTGACRFMCSWATREEEINALLRDCAQILKI
jgi:threonine aldolase